MGWIVTPRGAVSVRAAQAKEGSCQHPPHTTIPLASSIFWSEETGAHIVLGEIRDEYLRHDGPIGPLGYRHRMSAQTMTIQTGSATSSTA